MKRILYGIMLLFIFVMWFTAQARAEKGQVLPGNVLSEAKKGGYELISPDELEKEYRKEPKALLFVDTRQEWAYQMQHIEGAAYLPVTPTWWYQYSPSARADMRKVLGTVTNKKIIFY